MVFPSTSSGTIVINYLKNLEHGIPFDRLWNQKT